MRLPWLCWGCPAALPPSAALPLLPLVPPFPRNHSPGNRVSQTAQGPNELGGWVDEQQLIAGVRAGEARAERALYDQNVDPVFRLAYRMTGDEDLAQEFTQETFIRVFDRIDQFRGDAALSTWIRAVASTVVLNGLRKIKRFRRREVELEQGESRGTRPRTAEVDVKERLWQAIDDLPNKYRMVFVMHDVEGYTHEEIGSALGMPAGTSKAQLFRARARLRDALADFAGEWAS